MHVTWGIPPPPPERTREWALLHRIITLPDYSGKARIFLHNIAAGMDSDRAPSATRSSEDAEKFEADTEQYFRAGVFQSSVVPGKPLNPDRDFAVTTLTADEGTLMRADLLTPKSQELYGQLIAKGKLVVEANEGLGLLALRDGDQRRAREYFEKALRRGLTQCCDDHGVRRYGRRSRRRHQTRAGRAAIDPRYAPARWLIGEQTNDPRMRALQWKRATEMEPRRVEWWVMYARFCLEQKQYAEAGRAWMAAAQATPDPAKREEYLAARGRLDEQRLDSEAEVRKRERDEQARELEQLKTQARKEIADMEARTNRTSASKDPVFEWTDVHGTEVAGTLTATECIGKQYRLHLTTPEGQKLVFSVKDASHIDYGGERFKFSCGVQKPRAVSLTYKPLGAGAITGEVMGIESR